MKIKDFFTSILTYTPDNSYEFDYTHTQAIDSSTTDIPKKDDENKKIYPTLSVNLEYLKTKYNLLINSDIVLREFTLNARGKQYCAALLYIDGMIDSEIMDKFVLEPLMMRNKNNLYEGSVV